VDRARPAASLLYGEANTLAAGLLGETRLRELRAQAESMDERKAIMHAVAFIEQHLADTGAATSQ
jgi:hypothetical protein